MIKKIIQLLSRCALIGSLVLSLFNPLILAEASSSNITIADMRKNLAELKAQKAKIESSKQLTTAEKNKANQDILNARAEQAQIEKDIEAAKIKIKESEATIEKLNKESEALLRYFQLTKGDDIYAEYLAGASNLRDLIRRLAAVEQISDYALRTIENLDNLIIEKEQLQVELAKKDVELDNKIAEVSDKLLVLQNNLEEIADQNQSMDTQIKNQQEQINYYKQICSSENVPVYSCTSIPSAYGWTRPLGYGVITSPFGNRINPITGKPSSFHNGIDIGGNKEGTPIYASAPGRVSMVIDYPNPIYKDDWSCGGNQVFVHVTVNGVNYTVHYGHMLSIKVKPNQIVTTNTVIGTVGGGSTSTRKGGYDRCTTGAHLHYSIVKGFYGIDYKYWSTFMAKGINPPGYPKKGVWWNTR